MSRADLLPQLVGNGDRSALNLSVSTPLFAGRRPDTRDLCCRRQSCGVLTVNTSSDFAGPGVERQPGLCACPSSTARAS